MGPSKSCGNPPDGRAGPPADRSGEPPHVHSETLLGGHRQVVIVHNDEHYILRVTRQGKLILNK